MAITRYAGDRFFGLEAEKNGLLSQVVDGAHYTASDSRLSYVKVNGSWVAVTYIETGSAEAFFTGDLTVSIASGKTFGKYVNGDIIPASGKTPSEVIKMALLEDISASATLTSPTTIGFNQTGISNILNFSYQINTLNAYPTSGILEFRRGGIGSWSGIYSSTGNPGSYTHSLTDTSYNTSGFNYRYTIYDSVGTSGTASLTITPSSYSQPTASLSVAGINLISPESNLKREKGHINSTLGGTITRNSSNVNLTSYQWQYQLDGAGSWINLGSPVSIGPGTTAITSTGHSDPSLTAALSLSYRVKIIDTYQTYISSQVYSSSSTVNFVDLIFYGPTGSAPINSAGVRSLPSRMFTDDSNPFNLNTYTTERIFSVAMPLASSISQVLDLDAYNADITANYILSNFSVNDYTGNASPYNIYNMTNAIPYSSNHRHQITRTSA